MKAVLISIAPKWGEKIVNGEKTLEVRKTKPKLETPFKVYIYCTKDKKKRIFFTKEVFDGENGKWAIPHVGNGKVIGEFVCDRIDKIELDYEFFGRNIEYDIDSKEVSKTCLTRKELRYYGQGSALYGWHITDLKIYDKPKELGDFRKPCPYTDGTYCIEDKCEYYCSWTGVCRCWVERPPQSWCYVEV